MPASSALSIEVEVGRIRELSKSGRHYEALVAAEELAAEAPQNRDVLYLIAANQRCLNRIGDALASLKYLEQQHPRFSLLYQERGYCYTTLRDASCAIDAFSQAVKLNPALAKSWIMLERLYRMTGDARSAELAAGQISTLKDLPPDIVRAGSLISDGDMCAAESILRAYLINSGDHVEAFRLLATIQHQRTALYDAELLLEAALQLAPDYLAARLDHARVLLDRQRYLQARDAIDKLLRLEPDNRDYLSLYAAACVGLGQYETSITVYRQLLTESPGSAELHLALGHSLKSIGRQKEAVESYQTATALRPGCTSGSRSSTDRPAEILTGT